MIDEKIAPTTTSRIHYQKLFFGAFFIFSLYHLMRDSAQIMGIHHQFIDVLHTSHAWCGRACDVVTLPLDLLGIVGPLMIWRCQRVGKWGIILIGTIPLWLLFMWLP